MKPILWRKITKYSLVACSFDICKELLSDNGENIDIEEVSIMSDYWKKLDAIPFRVKTNAGTSDERASAAVRKAVIWLVQKRRVSNHFFCQEKTKKACETYTG